MEEQKNNKTLTIVLIVIIVILLGVIGYLLCQKNNEETITDNVDNTSTTTQITNTTNTQSEQTATQNEVNITYLQGDSEDQDREVILYEDGRFVMYNVYEEGGEVFVYTGKYKDEGESIAFPFEFEFRESFGNKVEHKEKTIQEREHIKELLDNII